MAGTREIAQQNGRKGGRPKGSVAVSTKVGIKTRELFATEVEKHLPIIFNALLAEVEKGNIPAAKELLDRAWGKPAQSVNMQVATFSLKELAEYRKNLIKEEHE